MLPQGDPFATLALMVDGITRQPLTDGNRIVPLVNGEEAYPAMLEAIESASVSIAMMSYIFDYDVAGKMFVEALVRAVLIRPFHDHLFEVNRSRGASCPNHVERGVDRGPVKIATGARLEVGLLRPFDEAEKDGLNRILRIVGVACHPKRGPERSIVVLPKEPLDMAGVARLAGWPSAPSRPPRSG